MGSGFKDWAAGEVLTAADVDGYLMRQTAMTFADASARDSALSGVLDEGMVAYLEDTNRYTYYTGSAWLNVTGLEGGSAVRVPGTFVADDVVQAAELNALPGGILDVDEKTTSTSINTSAATLATVSFTLASSRKIHLVGYIPACDSFSTNTLVYANLAIGGNTQISQQYGPGAGTSVSFSIHRYVELAAGSYTGTLTCNVASGTAFAFGNATYRTTLMAIDLGEV